MRAGWCGLLEGGSGSTHGRHFASCTRSSVSSYRFPRTSFCTDLAGSAEEGGKLWCPDEAGDLVRREEPKDMILDPLVVPEERLDLCRSKREDHLVLHPAEERL